MKRLRCVRQPADPSFSHYVPVPAPVRLHRHREENHDQTGRDFQWHDIQPIETIRDDSQPNDTYSHHTLRTLH